MLLREAMGCNARLQLWTFQRNANARAFYEAHGFACVQLTGGSDNEEHEPDARYVWHAPIVKSTLRDKELKHRPGRIRTETAFPCRSPR